MILRDVIIADQSRTLGRAPAPVFTPEPEITERQAAVASLLDLPRPAAADIEPVAETFVPPSPAPLTFEQVTAWLAVQDGDTRAACASLLSDELTAVHEKARLNGYEAGEQRARAEFSRQFERALGTLEQLTTSAAAAFDRECATLAEGCVDVVAEVLAKIAGPALASREAVIGAVLTVLSRVKDDRDVTIRVHANDLPVLQQEEQALTHVLGRRKFALVADTRVTAGGCIVETSAGSLDGRFEVQLHEMCETLRSAKAASREAP